MQTYICNKCHRTGEYKLKKDFEHFPYFRCTYCGKKTFFPLSKMAKTMYQVIIVVFILGFLFVLPFDYILFPGLLVLAAIEALIRNRKFEKEQTLYTSEI